MTERSGDSRELLRLLVLWRGTPGWFLPDKGSSSVSSSGGYLMITEGDIQLTLGYESTSRIVTIQGKPIEMGEDNVVFVDQVDAPAGPRVTRTLSIERAMPGSAAQLAPLLWASPEIMSFMQCDATTANVRRQATLEYLKRFGFYFCP